MVARFRANVKDGHCTCTRLNYPAIVRAILDTGYQGFLGQEFIPSRDPLRSLAQGFRICDV